MKSIKEIRVLLLGIALIVSASTAAHAGCGEATCYSTQGTYISHFTGAGCSGIEYYYLPYDNYGYQCRPGLGARECGTTQYTVTAFLLLQRQLLRRLADGQYAEPVRQGLLADLRRGEL
jgi:hypothetical protein